mgnify:CR=1 FL=1
MSADPNCIFCKIVAGQIPARKAHEDDQFARGQKLHKPLLAAFAAARSSATLRSRASTASRRIARISLRRARVHPAARANSSRPRCAPKGSS